MLLGQFLESKELKLALVSSERKLMQWRHRYVIEVVTDHRMEIVKKTFRDFQYFDKVVREKIGFNDKQLYLKRASSSATKYLNLQTYIFGLNQGYLLYQNGPNSAAANSRVRDLRSYLYTLLFDEDALFAEGVDDSDEEDVEEMKKSKSFKFGGKVESQSQKRPEVEERSKMVQKQYPIPKEREREMGVNMLPKSLLNLISKAPDKKKKLAEIEDPSSLKAIVKKIQVCWVKVANKYEGRDKGVIYQPYRWDKYGIQIAEKYLVLSDSSHRRIVALYNTDIQLNFSSQIQLTLKNTNDREALEIRLGFNEEQTEDLYARYLALYTQLKGILQAQAESEEGHQAEEVVHNKVRMRFSIKKNQAPGNASNAASTYHGQDLVIKVIHGPINLSIPTSFDSTVDLDLPIVDNFGSIDVAFTEQIKNNSFLPTLNIKEPQMSTIHIPVQTVYSIVYSKGKIKKKQNDVKGLTSSSTLPPYFQVKHKTIELKNTRAALTIDYKCLGNERAYCSCSPEDIYESDPPPLEFSRDELRMSMNRLKRILWTAESYSEWVMDLRNFTYPKMSYLFYGLVLMTILLYDNNRALEWLIGCLVLLLLYNNPNAHIYAWELIEILGYSRRWENLKLRMYQRNKLLPSDFHKMIRKTSGGGLFGTSAKVEKVEMELANKVNHLEHEYVKFLKSSQKESFLRDFTLTRKVKRSIYGKFRRFQEVLLMGQHFIFLLVGFVEKIKNIFMWYHYEKTKFLLTILLLAFAVLSILPLRLLCMGLLLRTMRKGMKYHQVTQDINRVIIIELLRTIIDENNYGYVKIFFKDHARNFDASNQETQAFFRKTRDCLSQWLGIVYDPDIIHEKSPNMATLVKNLSKCKKKFKIRADICLKYKFNIEWSKSESSIAKAMKMVSGFILSVPSDKFIIGVQTVAGGEEEEEEDMDELLDF